MAKFLPLIAAVTIALGLAALWWNAWPRPRLRRLRRDWLAGRHSDVLEAARTLLVPLKKRLRYRDTATVRLWIVAALWERGDFAEMAMQARQAIDESLTKGRPWQEIVAETAYGLAMIGLGRHDEARRPLEAAEVKSIAQQRPRVRMYIRTGLGWVQLAAGNRQLANDYARAACGDIRTNPAWAFEHPALLLSLARLCTELGVWDEATERFDELQAHSPIPSQRLEGLLGHARIDLERGNFPRAMELLQRVLKEGGKDYPSQAGHAQLYLARLHTFLGQPNEARLAIEQARLAGGRVDDHHFHCQIALAMAGQHRGVKRYADAREILLKTQVELLAEDPGVDLARTLVSWGELFLDQGNDREAYAHFRLADRLFKAGGQASWDIDLPYRLALLHHRMGLLDKGTRYEQEGDQLRRKLGVARQPEVLRKG
ncbi:MAG: hypothetical protein ABI743_05435 [bacterium]